jgi:hypothetical protein
MTKTMSRGSTMDGTPPAARSLILFANSRRIGGRPDLIADPATAGKALARAGLAAPGTIPTAATRRRLLTIRAALNDLLAGEVDAWTTIDAQAARLRVRLSFTPGGAALRPWSDDDPVGAVLALLYDGITRGWWSRIRLCANEVCAVAFYDATRSRTQRWHSYARCGNRANVAAHRARSAATAPRRPVRGATTAAGGRSR